GQLLGLRDAAQQGHAVLRQTLQRGYQFAFAAAQRLGSLGGWQRSNLTGVSFKPDAGGPSRWLGTAEMTLSAEHAQSPGYRLQRRPDRLQRQLEGILGTPMNVFEVGRLV